MYSRSQATRNGPKSARLYCIYKESRLTKNKSTFAMFSSLDVAKPGMYKVVGVCRLRSGTSEE